MTVPLGLKSGVRPPVLPIGYVDLLYFILLGIFYAFAARHVAEGIRIFGCPVVPFVRSSVYSSGQILLSPRYPMNALNSFDKTYREYSPVLTDDLIRFWRSKVKG